LPGLSVRIDTGLVELASKSALKAVEAGAVPVVGDRATADETALLGFAEDLFGSSGFGVGSRWG
jgi:hypothetical protein